MKKFDFFSFCHGNTTGTSQNLPVIYDHLGSGQDNKKNASIFNQVIKIKLFFYKLEMCIPVVKFDPLECIL